MVALQSAVELQKVGCVVKMLCSENSRLQAETENVKIKAIPIYSTNKKIVKSISRLTALINELEPDVIHTHHSHDLWAITPALKRAGSNARLFLTKHIASGVKKTDIFHKYLYNRVDGIFSVSNYILDSVTATCPLPAEKIHLLPNGIELGEFDKTSMDVNNIKLQLALPTDKLIISIIGRMTIGKGHEEFLNAAKIINEKHSNDVHYLIVGAASHGEDEYEDEIRKLTGELNIKNLTFTGHAQNVKQILAITDILAFPSHNESFGVTLIEAMAMSIPTAASGNAGVLDIVTDNVNGLLVEPRNAESLADALLKLIEDETLRSRLGNNGRKTVEEKFDIDIITNRLLKYYTE